MGKPSRVFIYDIYPIVRLGLRALLEPHPDFEVCGEADSGPVAELGVAQAQPCLVIMGLGLRHGPSLDEIERLRAAAPETRILIFSARDEALFASRAVRAGAAGYLMTQLPLATLSDAVRHVLEGRVCLSAQMTEALVSRVVARPGAGDPHATLSDRELQVLIELGSARGTRQIAERLGVSIKTIETHRANLKRKLGLNSAAELMQHAVRWVDHG